MNELFAERLRALKEERGVKQVEIARLLNVTQATVSRYFKGRVPKDLSMLKVLAEYFGVSVPYLVGHTDDRHALVASDAKGVYHSRRGSLPPLPEHLLEVLDLLHRRGRKLTPKEVRLLKLVLSEDSDEGPTDPEKH